MAICCPKEMSSLSIKFPVTNTYTDPTLSKTCPWDTLREVLSCPGHSWVSPYSRNTFLRGFQNTTLSQVFHLHRRLFLSLFSLYTSQNPRVQSSEFFSQYFSTLATHENHLESF